MEDAVASDWKPVDGMARASGPENGDGRTKSGANQAQIPRGPKLHGAQP
jgi:hypothetical protein